MPEARAAELERRLKQLWLDVVAARDEAFQLRHHFGESAPEHSALWLASDLLQQAARRVRRVVDEETR